MIRALVEQTFDQYKKYLVLAGTSEDAKPTAGLITGSKFLEVDTGTEYAFDEASGEWTATDLTPEEAKAAIAAEVSDWLDDHPEATTTVEDGAITYAKLNASLQGSIDDVGALKSAFGGGVPEDLTQYTDTTNYDRVSYTISGSNKATKSGSRYASVQVPIAGYAAISVTANNSKNAYITFVDDKLGNLSDGDSIADDLATGETGRHMITAGQSEVIPFASDAAYAVIAVRSDSASDNMVPASVIMMTAVNKVLLDTDKSIAAVETMTAKSNHSSGDLMMVDGVLYKANSAISAGDTVSSYADKVTVADELGSANTAISAISQDALMEPWMLMMQRWFDTDYNSGALVIRGNHYQYLPITSSATAYVRNIVGEYSSATSSFVSYTPTADQLIPVTVFGDAIKIGYYLNTDSYTIDRLPKIGCKFCTVSGDTVSVESFELLFGVNTDVIEEAVLSVPSGATHVYFGLYFGDGYNANVKYDIVYKFDRANAQ